MARPPAGDDDDLPWLAEGVREERATLVPRARLFGGGLLAVALAGLVGVGVYLASSHKSDGSGGYARPEDAPLITADTGAYKIAPANPGGAQQLGGIDDSVAATARGGDAGSAILPDEPEEPLARPSAAPAATGPATPAAAPTDLLPPAARAPVPVPVAPAPVVPPKAAEPKASIKASPEAKLAKLDIKPAAKPAARDDAPAAEPAAKPRPDTAKSDAPPGAVTLQLGAFSTRDKAEAAWIKAGGDGALAGLTRRIEPVERDGTTLYRLRAGGVASRAAAKALCGRLTAAGAACIVAE